MKAHVRPAPSRDARRLRAESLTVLGVFALFGALVLGAGLYAPARHSVRTAAEWIDDSPKAPVLLGAALAVTAAGLFLMRRAGSPARKAQIVCIGRCRTELWEGQRTIRVTDPQTAKIRFVLNTRKKAS